MKRAYKSLLSIFICAILVIGAFPFLSLQGFAEESVSEVYVSDSGDDSEDGSSDDFPVKTLTRAVEVIKADSTATSGKIILAGNVTTSAKATLKNTVPLTITSADKANFKLKLGGLISLYGATGGIYFTNIEINTSKSGLAIYGYGNKIVMGAKGVADDVITTTGPEGKQGNLWIIPGGNSLNSKVPKVDLEINSGTYSKVNMVGYSGGNVSGDVNIVINGGTIQNTFAIGSDGMSSTVSGKTNVVINGGTFGGTTYIGHAIVDHANVFEDDVTLKINGGTFSFSSTIVPHTGAGTITFDKGFTIDFLGFKGTAAELAEVKAKIDTATFDTEGHQYEIFDNIKLVGVQDSFESGDTEYNVRFVAILSNLEHDTAGFDIVASYGEDSIKDYNSPATNVYSKIVGSTATGITQEYTSEELGGNYIIALSITGIPVSEGEITFSVTPYTIDEDNKIPGKTFEVVYDSGIFVD